MVLKQIVKLNTGAEMPVLGFGVSSDNLFVASTIIIRRKNEIEGLADLISSARVGRNVASVSGGGQRSREDRLGGRVQAYRYRHCL